MEGMVFLMLPLLVVVVHLEPTENLIAPKVHLFYHVIPQHDCLIVLAIY